MADVKILRQTWKRVERMPQCSYIVPVEKGNAQYRSKKAARSGYDPTCCYKEASVMVKDKPYCTQHGGILALRILAGEEIS